LKQVDWVKDKRKKLSGLTAVPCWYNEKHFRLG